jgi:hypothetical protein
METGVLKALKGSIGKWQRIVNGRGVDRAADNCPLCKYFSNKCGACPVKKWTGQSQCIDTPFWEWVQHNADKHPGKPLKVYCPECKRLAKEELNFLEDLLPITSPGSRATSKE